jgi:hypothetical protein
MHTRSHLPALLAAGFLCTVLPCGATADPTPPPELVSELEPELVRAGFDPARLADWPEGLLTPIDVSADGVSDWLVDFLALGFPGWCGTGGCRHELWVSTGGGYRLALDAQVLEIGIRPGTARTLDLELHGSICGLTGSEACPRSFEWDASARRLVETANAAGGTLLAGPLFQPVADDPGAWPEPVLRARFEAEDRCVAAGGEYGEWMAPVISVPDIDGDGKRDWVLDESWTYCDGADPTSPAPTLRVFESNHGTWRQQLAVAATDWAVDISTHPASLVLTAH